MVRSWFNFIIYFLISLVANAYSNKHTKCSRNQTTRLLLQWGQDVDFIDLEDLC